MIRSLCSAFLLFLIFCGSAAAQNCSGLITISNGNNADATQVMANFNTLLGCVNNATNTVQQAGRLSYVSGSQLAFTPFNGNQIKINGALDTIPSGGIAGCSNTGAFVNETANQSLAASTLYYVYAFVNSGTVTCDFSTTGHMTSSTVGNAGTEIRNSDDTRSLIGLVYTNSSTPGQFSNNATASNVRSWFNRQSVSLFVVPNTVFTLSTTFGEVSSLFRGEFVSWANEVASITPSLVYYNNTGGAVLTVGVLLDGSTAGSTFVINMDGSGGARPVGGPSVAPGTSEGHHILSIGASIDRGVAYLSGASLYSATVTQ